MSWTETFELPTPSAGRIEVKVRVQIVNPRRCIPWGDCAEIYLDSDRVAIR